MEKGKDVKHSAAAISGLTLTKSPFGQEKEEDQFPKALKELKELGSQLYHAAEYWENAFSTSDQKINSMVAGTKSYIREAIVAVVDHLGNVSSKIEQNLFSETLVKQNEQRIDCLKQRILACQQ